MDLDCPNCAKSVRIPDDQNDQPGRRAKCIHCRKSFVVPEELLGLAAAPAPPATAPLIRPRTGTGLSGSATDLHRSAADLSASAMSVSTQAIPRPAGSARASKDWSVCALHPTEPSADVCENCGAGYCAGCARPMPGGKICPACQHPVMPVAERRRAAERERLRERPFPADVGLALGYPFREPVTFAMLTLIVGFFGAARGVSLGLQAAGFAYVFGQGLLMAYAFTALRRVAHGDLTAGAPDLNGVDDLARPIRLSLAAFAIAAAPLLITYLAVGAPSRGAIAAPLREAVAGRGGAEESAVNADQPPEAPTEAAEAPAAPDPAPPARPPPWYGFAMTLSFLWALGYFPVAFMVAAISQSVLATLDPREGVRAILAMGGIYWQAAGLTAILFLVSYGVRAVCALHPVAGLLAGPVVECWQWLTIACVLGLAIAKRAAVLGFD